MLAYDHIIAHDMAAIATSGACIASLYSIYIRASSQSFALSMMVPSLSVGLLCLLGFGRVGADVAVVSAHGDITPVSSGGGERRSLVRESSVGMPGVGLKSYAISEPDLHESLTAFAELQQPPVSLLAAQSMLTDECKATQAMKAGSLATKEAGLT